jgi:hypothetical protein
MGVYIMEYDVLLLRICKWRADPHGEEAAAGGGAGGARCAFAPSARFSNQQ